MIRRACGSFWGYIRHLTCDVSRRYLGDRSQCPDALVAHPPDSPHDRRVCANSGRETHLPQYCPDKGERSASSSAHSVSSIPGSSWSLVWPTRSCNPSHGYVRRAMYLSRSTSPLPLRHRRELFTVSILHIMMVRLEKHDKITVLFSSLQFSGGQT